jgi:homoserine O-acetyltransferase
MIVLAFLLAVSFGPQAYAEDLKFAELGDFKLESGAVIKDCKLAYRTMGMMNKSRSNIVLMTTWLMGTTQELVDRGFVGKGLMIDTMKYYVIAVDGFGNGVSSSPSNSPMQAGEKFPQFTIEDMVNAEYVLLTKNMKIKHIFAVAGISMGGMQALQWMVSYPVFMDKVVSIVSTPRLSSYDRLVWGAELKIIEASKKCGLANDEIMKALMPIQSILVSTPDYRADKTKPGDLKDFISKAEASLMKYDANNWACQVGAIMTQNIYDDFSGSEYKAAASVKAKALMITSALDNALYPGESRNFAVLINAEAPELKGNCGHFAFLCETDKLDSLVNGFLSKPVK